MGKATRAMGSARKTVLRTALDSYTILGERGAGGCGVVFGAADGSGKPCAVKLLDPRRTGPSALRRAAGELRFCGRNPHKNIARILDTGLNGAKGAFYVMPLYPRSLRDAVRDGIPRAQVLRIFGQILDGLEAAHLYQVWHGDLKPENVLLGADNREVAVADFGMAHFLRDERLQPAEDHRALPYCAPEQRQEHGKPEGKADVYALGILLHEMLTGSTALGPGELSIADVAAEFAYLDRTIRRMTHAEPARRPTVAEVKKELIARGNEFLCLQRLNALKTEILLETEVDDPLLRDPITIHAVDFRADMLYLTLNRLPPPDWILAFHGSGLPSSLTSQGTQRFVFLGKLAHLHVARGTDPQQVLDFAKAHVANANTLYAEWAVARHRENLERERESKRAQIATEERRHQVLARLRL